MTQVINSLRIEGNHRSNVKQENEINSRENMVETSNKSNFNNQFHSRGKNLKRNGRKNNNHQNHRQDNQSCHHQPNHKPINVKDKINEKGVCFVCKMTNHIAHDYYYKRTKEYKTNIKNKQDPRTLVNMLTNG